MYESLSTRYINLFPFLYNQIVILRSVGQYRTSSTVMHYILSGGEGVSALQKWMD